MIREYRVTLRDWPTEGRAWSRVVETLHGQGQAKEERAEATARRPAAVILARSKTNGSITIACGELSEATRRLEAFIRDLQEKRGGQDSAALGKTAEGRTRREHAGVGLGAMAGASPGPAEGRVVEEYGARVNPRSGQRRSGNGIDITRPEGLGRARGVPGPRALHGWFRGYGNLVIVDHGNEYYTLYAHMADIEGGRGRRYQQGR